VIEKILAHLGLWPAPAGSPPGPVPWPPAARYRRFPIPSKWS